MHETSTENKAGSRVQMQRDELERLVVSGRPSGLLMRSVATLKGLEPSAVAAASGIPLAMLEAVYAEQGVSALNKATIRAMADALGINLATMRFSDKSVHVLDYSRIRFAAGRHELWTLARAAGLLCRESRVVELKGCIGKARAGLGASVFAIQNEHSRVIVFSGIKHKFDIGHIPSASWARASKKESVLKVENQELIHTILNGGLVPSEFDELFMGDAAPIWEDVKTASRANGVSKTELLEFIRSRGEASEVDAEEFKPSLSLVGGEQRRVA